MPRTIATHTSQAEGGGPYRAIASGIPGRIGCDIRYFHEVDSTQRIAAALAEEGADQGTVVIAERQNLNGARTVAPDSLQNDPVLAKFSNCGRFLIGMLGSGIFADSPSCN